jgi:hypothetical protein
VPLTTVAYVTSDNAPGGAVFTFAFPIILFAVIASVLYYMLFARPHPRVPTRRIALAGSSAGAPEPGAAHAAAVAAGLPTASGGGSAESPTEPAGAKRETVDEDEDGTGSVSGEAGETNEGTEASE